MASRGQSITIAYQAWNTSTHQGASSDAGNHTLRLLKDGVSAAPTNAPAEIDSTNALGWYSLVLTAAETAHDCLVLMGKSSSSNVVILGVVVTFEQLPTAQPGQTNGLPEIGQPPLSLLGAAQIVTTGLVGAAGSFTLVQGHDYFAADGRSLDFSDASSSWPSLAGASGVSLTGYGGGGQISLPLSIVSTVAPQKVRLEASAAVTAALALGGYAYRVSATLASGHVVELFTGTVSVSKV